METQNDLKQIVTEKDDKTAMTSKDSNCCGPTCCGNSKDEKNNNRKDKQNGNS
jgi:hypothetical protein